MFNDVEHGGTEAEAGYDKQADFLEYSIWRWWGTSQSHACWTKVGIWALASHMVGLYFNNWGTVNNGNASLQGPLWDRAHQTLAQKHRKRWLSIPDGRNILNWMKGVVWTSGMLGIILLHLKVVYLKSSRILLQDGRISTASFSCSASSGSVLEAVFCLNCFAKVHLFLEIVSFWIFLFRDKYLWLSHHKCTFLLVYIFLWHFLILAIYKEGQKCSVQTPSSAIDLILTGE